MPNRWIILAGLWLVYASFGVTVASIAPLVAPIVDDLNMSHAAMGSIMGAWQLVYIGAAIPAGMLLDRLGGRHALLIGLAFILLSSAGRAIADSYWLLLAAVMVFGLGGPIISSGAPKLVAEGFSGSQRGLAMGIYMTGPALGGVATLSLTHSVLMPAFENDWRAVMWTWFGFVLLATAVWLVIGRLLPTHRADPDAPRETTRIAELVRQPAVRLVLLMSIGVFLFTHGLNNWLVEMLRHGGMTLTAAGYWATLPTVVGIVGSLLIPRLATPARRFWLLALLCALALIASVLLRFTDALPLTAGLVLQGIARSSLMTVLILTLVELPGIGERRAGTASGLFFSAAEIGGVLGPLGIGVLYDLSGDFNGAFTALSIVAALMMIGSILLGRLARPRASAVPGA